LGTRHGWYRSALIATVWLVVVGCAAVPTGQDPKIKWKLDAQLMVNDVMFSGVGVVKRAPEYRIEIYPRTKIDMAFVTTCHRDREIHATEIKKFLGSERQFIYTYKPRGEGLEDIDCPIMFNVLDKENVTSLRGMIDFEHPNYELDAVIDCDGTQIEGRGVSICQGKRGLMQRITFEENVRVLDPPKCGITEPVGSVFYFKPTVGECPVVFQSLEPPHVFHVMTIIGYESTFTEEMAK